MRKRWQLESQDIPCSTLSGWVASMPSPDMTLAYAKGWVAVFPPSFFKDCQWRVRHLKTGEIHYYTGEGKWIQIQTPLKHKYYGGTR